MKVNFCILVYFHFLDFIEFISNHTFSLKFPTKVYIQNIANKEVRTSLTKRKGTKKHYNKRYNFDISNKKYIRNEFGYKPMYVDITEKN